MKMNKLQILKDNKQEYVFCYNSSIGIVTTKDYRKALNEYDFEYFKSHFGNFIFRIVKLKKGEIVCVKK